MCDSPLFGDLGLGIHNSLPGGLFPFGFEYKDDPIDSLVDPGLTATPYTSSPNSSFPSPEQLGSSPPSCHDYFVDSRDSIGSLDAAAIAPDETVADNNTGAGKNSSHGPNNDSAKNNTSEPSKTTLSSALASSSSSTATTTPAAAPQPPANTSPIVTRTRKASSQNMDASGSTAQPRAKKQKTTIAVKLEPQEPQQRPQPQRQRQSSPPKRKPARRGSTAKKEDVAQRTKNLERNRIAASKCRQKKKEWVVELEEKKADLEARHNQLRIEYFELLGEVTSIKNELMAHAKCQDPNINFWIEKEAFKYVERCMDPVADRRPSMVGNAASGSSTLPSPAESHRSQQEPLPRPQGGINLDYMPDELLTGDLL